VVRLGWVASLAATLGACYAASDGAAARETQSPATVPSSTHSLPSREDLLKAGGLYPIPVPHGWKLINTEGEDEAIPLLPGEPFHRILARGPLLATEVNGGERPEVMTLRRYAFGEATAATLQMYATLVLNGLRTQGLGGRVVRQEVVACALTVQPCAKLQVRRADTPDDRVELHYLLRDHADLGWELVYWLRRDHLAAWAPLIAEVEGPAGGASLALGDGAK
jgi:hypothetical protein